MPRGPAGTGQLPRCRRPARRVPTCRALRRCWWRPCRPARSGSARRRRTPRKLRLRLVARAIGIRAAAPAEVFQAAAVMPAERRSGMSTPCAPKAAADRTIAPRLRGSVIESSATMSGSRSESRAAASRSSGWAYSKAGSCRAMPWCTAPPVSRSSSARVTSSSGVPRLAASLKMSRSRSSRSAPSATYAARMGISTSIASSTALRPTTHSGPDPGRPVFGADERGGLCDGLPPSSHGRQRDRADLRPSALDPFPPGHAAPDHPSRPYCLCPCAAPHPCAGYCPASRAYSFAELSAPVVAWPPPAADKSAWSDQRVPGGYRKPRRPGRSASSGWHPLSRSPCDRGPQRAASAAR